MYRFEKHSAKAFSWTRMKVVTQYFWIATRTVFGEVHTVAYSGELVHNRDDRDDSLNNFIKGIRAGSYEVLDKD